MQDWLINLATDHSYLIYIIILSIALIEGPIISLVVGFLTYLGYLNLELSILVLILGDVIPDIFLYYLGRFGHGKEYTDKHLLSVDFVSKNIKILERMWKHHPWKTIFFGKMAYGLSVPVLIATGLIKIPFKFFFYHSVTISIFASTVIFFIGYNLGYSYYIAEKYIKYVGVFFTILIALIIIGYLLLSRYFKDQFIEEEKKEENI